MERTHTTCPQVKRCTAEQPNHRHRRLLRTSRKRPHRRRTTEKCDEFAPSHVPERAQFRVEKRRNTAI